MGWLTSEELLWNDRGRLLTHSASTYQIPAFSDAPIDFRVRLIEEAEQPRTIGQSKAVGEPLSCWPSRFAKPCAMPPARPLSPPRDRRGDFRALHPDVFLEKTIP